MKRNSFAKRRDENEPEIVKALRDIGATVIELDKFDLLVGFQGRDYKIEVKNPDKRWRITDVQKDLIDNWRGSPLHIVKTVEEAIAVLKV